MDNVGPGENHGCPYRHSDEDSLRTLLSKSGIEPEQLGPIMQAAKDGHYQKACSMQFKAKHKGVELSTGEFTEIFAAILEHFLIVVCTGFLFFSFRYHKSSESVL